MRSKASTPRIGSVALTQAQQSTDVAYLAWTDACRQVTAEWEQIMSTDNDDEQRFAALIDFTTRYHPGRGRATSWY